LGSETTDTDPNTSDNTTQLVKLPDSKSPLYNQLTGPVTESLLVKGIAGDMLADK
jgi:hypothetical protein